MNARLAGNLDVKRGQCYMRASSTHYTHFLTSRSNEGQIFMSDLTRADQSHYWQHMSCDINTRTNLDMRMSSLYTATAGYDLAIVISQLFFTGELLNLQNATTKFPKYF